MTYDPDRPRGTNVAAWPTSWMLAAVLAVVVMGGVLWVVSNDTTDLSAPSTSTIAPSSAPSRMITPTGSAMSR